MSLAAQRPGWKDWLIVLALSAIVLLPGLASIPPVDRDESRYAVATTQMLETGDFVDIRFQEEQRYLQPAGVYWLQSIAAGVTGAKDAREIWGFRLPSFLAMLATIGMTLVVASHVFGRTTGVFAALLLATSFAIAFEARIAKTDAVLLATITAAHLALMRIYLEPRGHWWRPALFWAALGGGMMIKGPIILLFVGLALAALAIWDRKTAWLAELKPLWGVPLFLAVALPWYVAIGIVSDGAFYSEAIGDSLMGKVGESQQSHSGPFGYYLGAFTLMFWPASLFAVLGGYWAWINRREPAVRYLIAWIVPAWLVYELIATKLPHYVMPTYPALATIAAAAALAPGLRAPLWLRIAAGAYVLIWLAASGLIAGLGAAALHWYEDRLSLAMILFGALAFAAAIAAVTLYLMKRRPAALSAGIAAGALILPATFGLAIPGLDTLWLTPRIVAAAEAAQPCPDATLIASAYREPSLVFAYGPYRTRLASGPENAADLLGADPGCAMALIEVSEREVFLARAEAAGLTLTEAGRIEGTNYSNGDDQDLTLYLAGSR